MRDGIKFSNALRKKIEEYATTEHYAQSKSGKSKLTRSLDLVSGTNPRIREALGITNIPSDPYKALLSVRGVDEKTVQGLELIKTSGNGKLTGHHGTPAAAIGRALATMKPDDQEYVFKSLEDMYVKHGMDPAGILAVDGKEVHMSAHGKDWTGQRTGASLIPVPGEKGKDFMKRFSKAYNIQMDFNEQAFDMGLTKDWDAAFEGSADAMGMDKTDLNSSTTDSETRKDATTILRPTAKEVKQIVQSNAGNPAQIKAETQKIVSQGLSSLKKPNRALLQSLQSRVQPNNRGQSAAMRWGRQNVGAVNAGLIDQAGGFIKRNWGGEALGALTSLGTDPDQRQRLMDGDYKGVATNAIKGAATGAAGQGLLNLAIGALPKAVAPLATGAMQIAAPVAAGLALGEGLKANKRWRDSNERKEKARQLYGRNNSPQQIVQGKPTPKPQPQLTIQQTNNNTIHDSVTKMVDDGMNHLEYAMKNPLSIFGIK